MSGPTKDEDPTVAAVGLQGISHITNRQRSSRHAPDDEFKKVSAVLARESLELHKLACGCFLVTPVGNWMRYADLHEVRAMSQRVGARL
jgi:hypothetical protein